MSDSIYIAETDRLYLRELTEHDFDDLYKIYEEPEILQFIDHIKDYDTEYAKLQAYILYVYGFYGYGLWGVFEKDTHKLVGCSGIEMQSIENKDELTLSYFLDTAYWGKGYAQEACQAVLNYAKNELDITRVIAIIDAENTRSHATITALQFIKEKDFLYDSRRSMLYSKLLK